MEDGSRDATLLCVATSKDSVNNRWVCEDIAEGLHWTETQGLSHPSTVGADWYKCLKIVSGCMKLYRCQMNRGLSLVLCLLCFCSAFRPLEVLLCSRNQLSILD